MFDMEHNVNKIKYYRNLLGLTQQGLSDLCGISQNSISEIENGSGVSLSHASRIWFSMYELDNNIKFDDIFLLQTYL